MTQADHVGAQHRRCGIEVAGLDDVPQIHGGVSGWWSVVGIAVVACTMRALYRLIERGGYPQALRAA
ncbi:hypothetical protein [Corynebacterium kalidii]